MSKISETYGRLRSKYNNNLWQGRLILAAIIFLLVLLVVRISLSYTIVYSVTYWLNTQGVVTNIEDISINVRKGTFTLTGASGTRGGDSLFNIGRASIDWDWRPLSKKTIHITSVELKDFNLEIKKYSDAMVIAGIVIREGEGIEEPPDTKEDTVTWGASLRRIDFGDLGFCFQQIDAPYGQTEQETQLIDYCGSIDQLSWQGDFDFVNNNAEDTHGGADLAASGTLQVRDMQLFNNKLDSALINIGDALMPNIRINGLDDVKLEAINIDQFALLQHSGHSRHEHAVEFSKLKISGITYSKADTVSISAIELDRPVVSMAMDETGKYKYEQWLPVTQAAQPEPENAPDNTSEDSIIYKIMLGSISITDSELCYEQPGSKTAGHNQALDYCLNLAQSDWKGDITVTTPGNEQALLLSLNGSLGLSSLITTNNLLKRDLLAFDQLTLSKIAVTSLEDIAFDKLGLENLAGLELTTTEDRHSITAASIDVSDFSFRENTLGVSLVSVSDLGIEIAQNQDGTLDLDKWKTASEKQQAVDADADSVTDEKPLKIKIGEFNLDSSRLVEFTDMSVKPPMQVGLTELHFNIKKLDSEKPHQKSPLEFNAKTTRHGTIEIKGVAMPFEAKPSFDATGKVTGLDLRVASAKAEQAIGHIIKSGQMNADLKLLSDQGQLDSNIALVLHHFKLKAKSKEDAAALDKKFGMPINQSLMLLKDKKDRIKLDIPITGDINNPEFDPTDAIIKATAKATTVTLITFYTPYGLAYAGGNVLFNLATAMNFDPLIFEAGLSTLTDSHEGQLNKLAELLVERPAVHLVLCGSTNLGDRDKMFSEIIDPKKDPPPPSTERLQELKKLARERQQNVKNQLVTVGKIAHDRLILCEPEHSDAADAIAGVDISI